MIGTVPFRFPKIIGILVYVSSLTLYLCAVFTVRQVSIAVCVTRAVRLPRRIRVGRRRSDLYGYNYLGHRGGILARSCCRSGRFGRCGHDQLRNPCSELRCSDGEMHHHTGQRDRHGRDWRGIDHKRHRGPSADHRRRPGHEPDLLQFLGCDAHADRNDPDRRERCGRAPGSFRISEERSICGPARSCSTGCTSLETRRPSVAAFTSSRESATRYSIRRSPPTRPEIAELS